MMAPGSRARRLDRVQLAAAAVLIAAMSAGAWWLDRIQRAHVTTTRSAELASMGELKTDWIVQWLGDLVGDLRQMSDPRISRPLVDFVARPGDAALLAEAAGWIEATRMAHDHEAALLIGTDGKVLISSGERMDALDPQSIELLNEAIDAEKPTIGPMHRSAAAAGRVRLDVAGPIRDSAGTVRAVLMLRVAPEKELFPLVRRWPTPSPSAESLLARLDGGSVVFMNPLRHVTEPAMAVQRPADLPDLVAAQAARGGTGIVRGTDYRGVEVLADLRRVPGTQWLMVTKVDADELLADARTHGMAIAAAALVLFVTVLLALWALAAVRHRDTYRRLFLAERERAEMLDEFRATLRGIGDGVLSTDVEGRVRRMNRVAESLTGWDEARAAGQPVEKVFTIVNENTRAIVENPVSRVLSEGKIVGLANHTVLIARDGTERPIADSGAPIHDADGRVIGAVLVFRDHSPERERERALRETASYYQLMFMASPLPMWVFDEETRGFLAVNDATVRQYGWSRAEFAGLTLADIEDVPEALQAGADVVPGAAPASRRGETLARHRRRDGTLIEARVFDFRLVYQGRAARLMLTLDITDRVRVVRELAASTAFLRGVLDSLAMSIAILDETGRIVAVNEAWRRFARDNGGDVSRLCEGADYLAVCDRAHGEETWEARAAAAGIRRILAGEAQSDGFEYRCDAPGQRRWFLTSMQRVAGQGPGRVVVSHLDISAHRLAEEEQAKLAQAISQSSECVVITDASGAIEYVNEAAERVSGYSKAELLGRNPNLLASGKTPPETYRSLWANLAQGKAWSGQFVNRKKNGDEYVERAVITPIRTPNLKVTHYVAVKEDVTERQKIEHELEHYRMHLQDEVAARTAELTLARQQAEAANQAKSMFLANMSHEIRTPMNGVLGLVEVLGHTDLDEHQRELLRTVQESGSALLALIDEILDFSKIEAERLELHNAPFDLVELAEGIVDSLLPLAARGNSELSVFVSAQAPPRVSGDALRLRQMLVNLLGNALKFSGTAAGRPGRVSLTVNVAQREPLELEFVIRDNGVGIDPSLMPRLFEPFVQGNSVATRGTGLGLPICKRLSELMGGRIDVASTPGSGSTFTVTIPFDVAPGEPTRRLADLSGLDVVVLSAAACDFWHLTEFLEQAGARVARAADAAEAELLARQCSSAPLLVVCAVGGFALTPADFEQGPWRGQLWVTLGGRRRPRLEAPGVVGLDVAALRRAALLSAAAVAAGRLSPREIGAESGPAPAGAAPAGREPMAPPADEGPPRGAWILVAEDDEVNLRVISEQLKMLGHPVRAARNGAEALRMWRERGDALLLTDLNMPEMDGYTLASTIRSEEARRAAAGETVQRLPIIALTANALNGEAERSRQFGFDEYLVKPVQLDRLRDTLDRWILPAVDIATLKALIGDAPDELGKLLVAYRAAVREKGPPLVTACRQGNAAQAAAIAHQLKSSSRAVGAHALGAICEEIERYGIASNTAALAQAARAVDAELERVDEAIGRLLEAQDAATGQA